jgi:hypothetical protein
MASDNMNIDDWARKNGLTKSETNLIISKQNVTVGGLGKKKFASEEILNKAFERHIFDTKTKDVMNERSAKRAARMKNAVNFYKCFEKPSDKKSISFDNSLAVFINVLSTCDNLLKFFRFMIDYNETRNLLVLNELITYFYDEDESSMDSEILDVVKVLKKFKNENSSADFDFIYDAVFKERTKYREEKKKKRLTW